ncbi:MAG: hypothetical protein Q7K42_05790 [Candidatus Diapherotrites archaeon]|nr:hypothetical protein [Candidatus Diapherotrites archaeon]
MKRKQQIRPILKRTEIRRMRKHPFGNPAKRYPVYSLLFDSLEQARRVFGKKLKLGINELTAKNSKREKYSLEAKVIQTSSGKIGVTPVMHGHGLVLSLDALDHIFKKQKISPYHSHEPFNTARLAEKTIFEGFARPYSNKGLFFEDRIFLELLPTHSSTEHFSPYSFSWLELPATDIKVVHVLYKQVTTTKKFAEKKKAYAERYPGVIFEFEEY